MENEIDIIQSTLIDEMLPDYYNKSIEEALNY
jgi:hypothetical protein